jgi:hypothetical protein
MEYHLTIRMAPLISLELFTKKSIQTVSNPSSSG